jgi:sugar phosphate isomerase/epimerase
MIKPCFSSVACPEWTLDEVAASAARYGFEGIELRTFGDRSARLACDPALTSDEKARRMFHAVGVEILSLGTSVSFDEPVRPPIIGMALSDTERTVRAAKRAIDAAVALECPFVRVFGFQIPARESRASTTARIASRLRLVADHAAKTGVRIVIENGGDFSRAAELAELVAAVDNTLVGACYSLAAGVHAGDHARDAISVLGTRLWLARVKDIDTHGHPVQLGAGTLDCRSFVTALASSGFDGPLVFEWDRLWVPSLAPAAEVLPVAAKSLFHWIAEGAGPSHAGGARAATTGGR